MDEEQVRLIKEIVREVIAEEGRRVYQTDIPRGTIKQGHIERGAMVIFRGLAADIPDGSGEVQAYYSTDTSVLSIWDGSVWKNISLITADTGWAIINKAEDKTLDCNVGDTLVTSDVVGTLIDVLISYGLLSA